MTKKDFERMIRNRIRVSERAIKAIIDSGGSTKMVDYHSGCIGIGYCLLGDLSEPKPKKAKR